MGTSQKVIPLKGTDFDTSESFLEELKACYLKNVTDAVNDNSRSSIQEGSNKSAKTPLEANSTYCNVDLPAGTNHVVGFGYFGEVNQAFVCVWNSNNNHLIYRLKCDTGTCEIVYKKSCLNFQLDPRYFINETRMTLEVTCRFSKITNKMERVMYLILVDDFNNNKMICVEDSIATKFFSKDDFPYFQVNDDSCTDCSYINLSLPQNLDCIAVEPVERDLNDPEELLKNNLINNKIWQFRVKGTDVWRRYTEHGMISVTYVNAIGGSCVSGSTGRPRCLKLTFKAFCPIIDKIEIEFRTCNGNVKGLSPESDWLLHDTIEKYNNCEDKEWWERSINTNPENNWTYNPVDNTISYIFCADKECQAIPVGETNRNENFMPHKSGGVFSINKSIALLKNTRGFEPLSCNELDKMNFTVVPPTAVSNCLDTKLVKVYIYGLIWNLFEDTYAPLRYSENNIVFGIANCPNNNPYAFGQVMPKDQEGFVGYMAGTSNYNVSKQFAVNRNDLTEVYCGGVFPGDNGGSVLPLQKWEFDLLPGRYVFRISSHRSKPTDDYQKTSTYTIGRTTLNGAGGLTQEVKEIIIDVCAGEEVKIINEPIMIYDLTRKGKGCLVADASSVNEGYLYEDEVEKRPVELATVLPNYPLIYTHFTDHNGFYFSASRRRRHQTVLYARKSCTYVEVARSRETFDNSGAWYRYDELYVYKALVKYPIADRILVKGRIVLCNEPNVGLAGALVVLTRGQFTTTDNHGYFTIIAHDKQNDTVRVDNLIYSQKGACVLMQCGNDCNYCFPNVPVVLPTCTGLERIVTAVTLSVKINGYNKKGPHMGGRYGIGIVEHDDIGRETYVQNQEKHYIDIPSLQETKIYDFSRILYDITGMVFKPTTVRVSFWITENLNEDDYLVTVAERIQLVDNTGKPNSAAPTKIRLYYESLNEYNKQNDGATNTVWGFIKNDDLTVTGDQVEILANNGVIYTKKIKELVTYDKIGKYISIPYTEDLKDLKDGCLIKLIHPKQCVQKEFFYELCPSIKVVNQQAVTPTGELNFFDAYIQSRQYPVPVTTEKTTKDANNNEIITSTTENQLRNFPYLYEHHSPSDFWGDHCWSKGRVSTKNPYENIRCRKTEISVGKALSLDNLLNGLGYFDAADSKVFNEQNWGEFVAGFADTGEVMVICANNCFTVPFNDTNIRAREDGTVYAPTAENRFGEPRKMKGGDFGCNPEDINTLKRDKNIVMGLYRDDSALVVFQFGEAINVAENGAKGYISSNIKALIASNNGVGRKKYFHGVIDPKTKKYLLSQTNILQTSNEFINQHDEILSGVNDTLVFDLKTLAFGGCRSYVPEYFGSMTGDIHDQQLISFRFGVPWLHNKLNNSNPVFNNFYGVQCAPVFEFVFNLDYTKVKKFMWLETYCKEILFYSPVIRTSSGQISRIMPLWWEKRDKFWAADIKCAVNTVVDANMPVETGPNALLDGDSLYGTWIKIRIKPKVADWSKYFEFISMICFMNGSEKSGGAE